MKQRNQMQKQGTLQQNLFSTESLDKKAKQKKTTEDDYVFDILDALNAPILTFSQPWADIIPKRIIHILPLARMVALMRSEKLATYAECCIYIYTRTLDAPMDHDWTDIYTHVSCKTLEEWFGENHWQSTNAPPTLNEWLLLKLDGLRRHIYNKRREILKSRLKQQEQTGIKVDAKLLNEKTKRNSIEQGTFQF